MEMGHTATAGQHYNKRWDAGSRGKDAYFSAENWKDSSNSSNGGSWKLPATSTSASLAPSSTSSSSTSPSQSNSLSSLVPIVSADGNVDKVLYQNLVEMIPLVETFMDKKNNKSAVTRHASLVYTPTPSHKIKGPGNSFKGTKSRGEFLRYKGVDMKNNAFWKNAENFNYDSRDEMLFSTDLDAVDKAIITRLQDQVDQLEQKLQEKERLLREAEENMSRQPDILSLQAKMEELHNQNLMKEQEGMDLLSRKQHEVESLRSLLKEAESEVQASNVNVEKVQEELNNLQGHVATFLVRMQNILLRLENEQTTDSTQAKENGYHPQKHHHIGLDQSMENGYHPQKHHHHIGLDQSMELMRRKYVASLIAAREKPSEELLLLVAELREQLQHYILKNVS